MRLNHIHLMVSDVEGTRAFLETYFGMNTHPGARPKFAVMRDDAHNIVTLMQGKDCVYPKHFHVGFTQPDEQSVNALYERLKAAGHSPSTPERSHAWSFYIKAPGGFLIEVLA